MIPKWNSTSNAIIGDTRKGQDPKSDNYGFIQVSKESLNNLGFFSQGLWDFTLRAYAKGEKIFVIDMGEPVKILDLAKNLILLSGHKPDEDIPIVFTGLRPGEKLYEEMLMEEEGLQDTENKLIHIGKPIEMDEKQFLEQLNELKEYVVTEPDDIREWVKRMVPTYHPEAGGQS